MKRCSKCGETKPVSQFWQRSRSKDGLDYYCKACRAKGNRTWRQTKQDPERERARSRLKAWKAQGIVLTHEQYDQLLEYQGGRCAVCKQKPRKGRLHVDHDHDTGKVRGLVCRRCNTKVIPIVEGKGLTRLIELAKVYVADPPADHVLEEAA